MRTDGAGPFVISSPSLYGGYEGWGTSRWPEAAFNLLGFGPDRRSGTRSRPAPYQKWGGWDGNSSGRCGPLKCMWGFLGPDPFSSRAWQVQCPHLIHDGKPPSFQP